MKRYITACLAALLLVLPAAATSKLDYALPTSGDSSTANTWSTTVNTAIEYIRIVMENRCYDVKDYGAKGDGTTDDRTVLQALINTVSSAGGGTIFFPAGTYRIASALTITYSRVKLEISPGASLVVDEGYAGNAIVINADDRAVEHTEIYGGGKIYEAGTPSRNWNAIVLDTDAMGIYWSYIHDIQIVDAHSAIVLNLDYAASKDPAINSNAFSRVYYYHCVNNVLFSVEDTPGTYQCNGNVFDTLWMQADTVGGTSEYGIKNVMGARNLFLGCQAWDYASPRPTISISSNASYTMVLGGTIGAALSDSGTSSHISTYECSNLNYINLTRRSRNQKS